MPASTPVCAIVGAGPGLGAALAARFARGGHAVAAFTRHAASRAAAEEAVRAAGVPLHGADCDAGDPESVAAAFSGAEAALGAPDVLVYNAGLFLAGGVLELEADAFAAAWQVNCLGAFHAARAVLPAMLERGRGTILLSGATAALRGGAGFAGIAVGKFGLRALGQSLAREFGPRGIHVAHVIIDGQIATPRNLARMPDRDPQTLLTPESIAEQYWWLASQPRDAWTQELDLRPDRERF